jgi:vancomycin permeability regulator SanA
MKLIFRIIRGIVRGVFRRVIALILFICILVLGGLWLINSAVQKNGGDRIISAEQAAELEDVDCILVLGCLVKEGGEPSDMLHDRLQRGVELYNLGAAPKLLMTGDHGSEDYDEVAAMKQYAVDAGIPSEHVFMDHAGFSTYESIYRAKEIFQAEKILIVSQEYHLYRALYIADKLGVEAYGVGADYRDYIGQAGRNVREMLARIKDWVSCIFKPIPTYLGDAIPIFGDGNLTNDENSHF